VFGFGNVLSSMKLLNILFILLSGICCGILVFGPKDYSRKIETQTELVDAVNQDQFSSKHINYQLNRPPPGSDDYKIFGSINDIVKRGELIVCTRKKGTTPIFQMKTKNGYVGEDIAFAKSIADSLGVKLTMRMLYDTCDDVVDAIANREGDVGISKISYTDKRAAKVLYTSPYVVSNLCILVNRLALKKLKIQTIGELFENKKAVIAGNKNTSYDYFAHQFSKGAKVVSVEDWENGIVGKVRKGEFAATVRDALVIKLLLHSDQKLCIEMLPIMLKDEADTYAAVVNNEDSSLCAWINRHLSVGYKEQRSVDKLIQKYSEHLK
jgi:ABC-type amino acid transport substrate-binding protein